MGLDKDVLMKVCFVFFIGILHLPRIYSFKIPSWHAEFKSETEQQLQREITQKQKDAFYLPALAVAKRGHGDSEQKIFFKTEFETRTYVTRHEDVLLECVVGGAPTPTIHWLKNGIRIPQGKSHDQSDDDVDTEMQETPIGQPMLRLGKVISRLYIDCVSTKNMGEYTCVAETPTEKISQTTEVKMSNDLPLQSKASCITKKAFRGEPARIYLWTALRLEFEGASVQLMCRGEGYPAPTCSWRYGEFGDKIEDSSQYKTLQNGDLVIRDVNWMEHMGDFFCRCENESGSDEVSTFLYPTEP